MTKTAAIFIAGSRRCLFTVLAATAVLFVPAGCQPKSAVAPATPPPTPVGVLMIAPRLVNLTRELPGRTSASRIAEVRARISGIVQKRLFTEGGDVSEGQVLFEIDPAPYQAALDSARANLTRAEAGLASARVQAGRLEGLVPTHAVSQQTYDDASTRHLAAAAEVEAARAAVRAAEINLGYTRVTAPISGRIGRAGVTEGAYVQQATATLLAVIQQLDPLYIDLSQSADEVLKLKDALAAGRLVSNRNGDARLTVLRANGTPHPEAGSLQFSDVSVDPGTGSVTLRGLLPNPELRLLPGMFVRARLDEGTMPDAILVPQAVVSRNPRGDATVLLVGAAGTVEMRVIGANRTVGTDWLVNEGLKSGDRVIIDHLQKIRPGQPVQIAAPAPAGN